MTANPDPINAVFAATADVEICDALYFVLHQRLSSERTTSSGKWPESWAALWSVWRHYWIWKNDGFASLWELDSKELFQFCDALNQIGDPSAGDFLQRSLEAFGLDQLGDPDSQPAESRLELARPWNDDAAFYWGNIEHNVARFVRSHRLDFLPLMDGLIERLKEGTA